MCTGCLNGYLLDATLGVCTCTNTMILNQPACISCATKYGSNCATCD